MESSASLHEISALLGHANISQTSTYLKTTPTRMREALERMEALKESAKEPSDDVAESDQMVAVN